MRRTVALIPVVALALGACGSHVQTPAEQTAAYILTSPATVAGDARTALESVSTLHLVGTTKENGQTYGLDLRMDRSKHCAGTLTLQGQPVEMVINAKGAYLKAGANFWQAAGLGAVATMAAGRWITGIPGASSLAGVCDLAGLVSRFLGNEKTVPTTVGGGEVAGIGTVNIRVSDAGGTKTIAVAATTPHYPMKVTSSSDGEVTLSGFNEPVNAATPTGDVLDLATLGAK